HAVAEDPEEQHVAQDVPEPAVQKLVGEELPQFQIAGVEHEPRLDMLAEGPTGKVADHVRDQIDKHVDGDEAVVNPRHAPHGRVGSNWCEYEQGSRFLVARSAQWRILAKSGEKRCPLPWSRRFLSVLPENR